MIYYTIIAMLICLTYLEWSGKDNNILGDKNMEKYCYVFMATLLTLVSALRYEVGDDWQNYVPYFYRCVAIFETERFEYGYHLLNIFFRNFTDNYYVMQFVISVFCCGVFFHYFYKKSITPIFILLVYFLQSYFFALNMVIVRQCMATAIIVLGMQYLEKKRLINWIMVVLLAMLFHRTAIFAFPLYYTTRYSVSRKMAFIAILITLYVNIFGQVVTNSCLRVAVKFSYMPENVLFLINKYLSSTKFGQQMQFNSGLGAIVTFLFNFFIVALYQPDTDKYMLNFLIAFFIMAVGRNFDVIGRIHFYYTICGGGIFVYEILDRRTLPLWCSMSRKFVSAFAFVPITFFILYTTMAFCKSMYGVDVLNRTKKDLYIPYKMSIFR